MKRTIILAAVAVLAAFVRGAPIHAEPPQECREQCSLAFEACKHACTEGRGFDGCEDECGWVYDGCVSDCH